MKKYLNKIIALSLLTLIFPMIGGLCFQNLIYPAIKIDTTQAAGNNLFVNAMADSMPDDMNMVETNMNDTCQETEATNQTQIQEFNLKTEKSLPMSSDNNSLLPCCVGGTHPNIITSSQSLDLHQFHPLFINIFEKLALNISEAISYQAPITAPPELKALQTTILRI